MNFITIHSQVLTNILIETKSLLNAIPITIFKATASKQHTWIKFICRKKTAKRHWNENEFAWSRHSGCNNFVIFMFSCRNRLSLNCEFLLMRNWLYFQRTDSFNMQVDNSHENYTTSMWPIECASFDAKVTKLESHRKEKKNGTLAHNLLWFVYFFNKTPSKLARTLYFIYIAWLVFVTVMQSVKYNCKSPWTIESVSVSISIRNWHNDETNSAVSYRFLRFPVDHGQLCMSSYSINSNHLNSRAKSKWFFSKCFFYSINCWLILHHIWNQIPQIIYKAAIKGWLIVKCTACCVYSLFIWSKCVERSTANSISVGRNFNFHTNKTKNSANWGARRFYHSKLWSFLLQTKRCAHAVYWIVTKQSSA